MYKAFFIICLLLFVSFAQQTIAVEVKDLYLVKLEVKGQGKTERWKATLSGFREVLIRKSGSNSILQSYSVQQAYPKVTNYLQRFEYSSHKNEDNESVYLISLYFEPRLINNVIQQSQMPLWGSNRPVTLLWLAIEEDFERRIIHESQSSSPVEEQIDKDSIRRGVPIILPLMDLDDELKVSISDVWGRFAKPISEASLRYAADSVLFGRIQRQGERWNGKFGYLNQGTETAFELFEATQELIISKMMDRIAELLCEKYCVVEEVGLKNEVMMDISDINSFTEFKQLESYLTSLSSISKIELVTIAEDRTLFKLTLLGQLESVIKGISLSQKMLPIDPIQVASNEENFEQVISGSESLEAILPKSSERLNDSQNEDEKGDDEMSESENTNLLQTLYYRWVG